MSAQLSLFGASNLAITVAMPQAPTLIPHTNWPYPGVNHPALKGEACKAAMPSKSG